MQYRSASKTFLAAATFGLLVGFVARANAQAPFSRTPSTYRNNARQDGFRQLSERDLYRLNETRQRTRAYRPNGIDDGFAEYPVRPASHGSCADRRPHQTYRPVFDEAPRLRPSEYDQIRRQSNYHLRQPNYVSDVPRHGPVVSQKFYQGRNVYGQPSVFHKNQPVRNFMRSLIP